MFNLNSILSSLIILNVLSFSACTDPTSKTTEIPPEEKPSLANTTQIQIEGLTISGDKRSGMKLICGIEYLNDYLYLAETNGNIHRLTVELSAQPTATLDPTFGDNRKVTLPHKIKALTVSGDSLIIETQRGKYRLTDGLATKIDLPIRKAAFTDDGSTGIGESGGSIRMIKIIEGNFEAKPLLAISDLGLSNINKCYLTPDKVVLGGSGTKHELVVCSYDGDVLFRFGNDDAFAPDGFGYTHDIESIDDSYLVLDSNLRDISVISQDGNLTNKIDLHKTLGVGYSWFPDTTVGPDNSLIIATVNDDDEDGIQKAKLFVIPQALLNTPLPE